MEFENTFLRFEEYYENSGMVGYSFATQDKSGTGINKLMEENFPVLNDFFVELYLQTAKVEIDSQMSKLGKILIKTLTGIN